MTVDEEGLVSWVPTISQQGSNAVRIQIDDGRGGIIEQSYEIAVGNESQNSAPEILSTPEGFGVTVERTYRYNAQATDPDGDVVLWQLTDAPTGMSLDPETGTLRWQPTADQIGRHTVSLQAIDAQGAFSGQSFELTVRGRNTAPLITSIPPTTASGDRLYQYQLQATDAEGGPLSFRLLQAPAQMSIDAQTGLIEWQPDTDLTGTAEIIVEVSDSEGASSAQTYEIALSETAPNGAPAITSAPIGYALTGTTYQYQIEATDPDNDTLVYELIDGPDGMAVDASTGELTWDTTDVAPGQYTIVVGANDGALGGAQRYVLQVVAPAQPGDPVDPTGAVNNPPEILSTPTATALVGDEYRYDLRAQDANGDPLSYRLLDAPEGMTVDQYGRIRWMPTENATAIVEVAVSDIYGATVTQQYTLVATVDDIAPEVRVQPSLVPADVNQPLTVYMQATDNVGVVSSSLTIDGEAVPVVRGAYQFTPTEVGDLVAIASATDAAGNTTTTETIIEVRDFSNSGIAPTVSLDSLTGQVLTGPTDIFGSVQDDNLVSYNLSLAKLGSNDFREIYRGTDTVDNGDLGQLDTSLFQNDSYTLRLTAEDGNGNVVYVDETVNIGGDLKLGNFTLSFTDMALPVSGIPVAVTRTYDSLNADETDDFGYGWRLEFRDTDLRTSLGRDEQYETFGIRSKGFEEGTRVYLTLPGGQRQGFTFKPRQVEQIDGEPLGIFSKYFYEPVFESDDGVTSTLSVRTNEYLTRDANGDYVGFQGSPFNPADYIFGGVYVLTTQEGIEYEIDGTTGDLTKAKDLNGDVLTFDDSGIYSDTGVAITFGRDAQGRINSIQDPEGNEVTYRYDDNGDLVAVTDAENYTTQFNYRDEERYEHFLEEVIDPLGRVGAKSTYDEQGRLSQLFDVDGDPVEIVYDPENSTQIVKDALGQSTFYEYDSRGNVIQQVDPSGAKTFLEYNDANDSTLVTRVTDDNGNVVDYTYDANGYLASRTALHNPNNENPDITYYQHNSRGQMTSIVLPTGSSFSMEYDSRGNQLAMKDGEGHIIQSFKYDAKGRLIEESDPFGTTSYDNPETENDFDAFGNPYWMKDSTGEVTTMTYTASGQLKTMTDSEGTSTFTYDKLGRETRADYGDGLYVNYGYGPEGDWTSLESPTIGRIERKFNEDGSLGGWITADGGELTYTYDALGRLETETTPDGRVTRYEYDDVNRTNRVIDVASGLVAETVSDNVGRAISRTQILNEGTPEEERYTTSYTYYDDGRVATTTDPNGNTWQYEYTRLTTTVTDPLGRKTTTTRTADYLPGEVRYADSSTARSEYLFNNNLLEGSDYPVRVIDRGGNDRRFGYDERGRLATATDLGENSYSYSYGDSGLASITAPTGHTRQYTYDDDDNLTSILYDDGTAKQFRYNADNRLEQVTLASGETITYTYDETGRVVSEVSSTGDTVTTTYDEDSRVSAVTNSSGTTTYLYDSLGNLSGVDSPNGSRIRYSHDALGRVIQIAEQATADAPAAITQYRYDALGNLLSVVDPTGGETVMTYDAVNRLVTRSLPNGVTTTYGYNEVDQVISIAHTGADGTTISSLTYERTGTGEPSKITREDGSYRTLNYDESLRLVEEAFYDAAGTLQETITYSYDESGQRIAHSDQDGTHTYSYGDGFQLETVQNGSETETYTHDDNGRLSGFERDGENVALEHNAKDQLTIVTNATTGETVTYTYDGEGNRISETVGSETIQYLVAPSMGSGLSVQDLITDATGNVLANHVYVGETPLARLDGAGNAVYYLTDAMGSVIGLVDSSGQSVAAFDYDGFGNVRGTQGSDATGEALGGDFRFQSQWLESESGLYYFRARNYDAETGRFISRDPIDIIETAPESFNPYQFVYNNPLIYSDPTGEITITELNGSKSVQGILNRINATLSRYASTQAKELVREKLGEAVGNSFVRIIDSLLPGTAAGQFLSGFADEAPGPAGGSFENLITRQVCDALGVTNFLNRVWMEPEIKTSGRPHSDGLNCAGSGRATRNPSYPNPDFLIKNGLPTDYKVRNPDAYLIGDIKLTMTTALSKINRDDNQWQAMYRHARRFQMLPLTMYVSFRQKTRSTSDAEVAAKIQQAQRVAFRRSVVLFLVNIFD